MSPTQDGRYATKVPDGLDKIITDLPLRVESVDVKGKFMWWTLTGGDKTWYMWSTYGMSGQWSRTRGKHAGFIVDFNGSGSLITRDQQQLFFNDTRRFGTVKFVSDPKIHAKKLASLGPDILDQPPVDSGLFAERILLKPSRTICEALMDQSCVSGIGNYLRAEILYDCGLDPWRSTTDLTAEQYVQLCNASIRISTASYKSQGASIKTYRNPDDVKGSSQFSFKVYARNSCPLGHETTRKQDTNARMIHWCSICQK